MAGLSAVETGVRLLPLSVALLVTALGVPKLFPDASPRRVVRLAFAAMFTGLVVLMGALELGAGAEIVSGPLLLVGLGIGGLASQLGSVTVSAVPDEQSGEVGGLQNTVAFLGSSIGTALAGAVLVSALTTSFFATLQADPDVPPSLAEAAQVELTGGVPFVPDSQLQAALDAGGVDPGTAAAVVDDNAAARINGLRAALAVLALACLLAVFFTGGLPTRQAGAAGNAVPHPQARNRRRR